MGGLNQQRSADRAPNPGGKGGRRATPERAASMLGTSSRMFGLYDRVAAPYVARTRTCAGDLRIPMTAMHASFRFLLAAAATHPPPELLIPPAGPVRSVR